MTTPIHVPILDALKDSDSNLPAQPESTAELARKAEEPASEALVDDRIARHAKLCSAARTIKRYALVFVFASGALMVYERYQRDAERASNREMTRQVLREELPGAVRLIVQQEMATMPRWLFPQAHAETKGATP